MLPREQEEFFKLVRKNCPERSSVWASGYVHGYVDEAKRSKPGLGHPQGLRSKDEYSTGYVVGFAVRRGGDAECEPWYPAVAKQVKNVPDEIR